MWMLITYHFSKALPSAARRRAWTLFRALDGFAIEAPLRSSFSFTFSSAFSTSPVYGKIWYFPSKNALSVKFILLIRWRELLELRKAMKEGKIFILHPKVWTGQISYLEVHMALKRVNNSRKRFCYSSIAFHLGWRDQRVNCLSFIFSQPAKNIIGFQSNH